MPKAIQRLSVKKVDGAKKISTRKTSTQRGYNHTWRKARKAYLEKHPLCVFCKEKNIIKSANVVDHITPHRGDMSLFWDSGNWQSLCKRCHDSDKQRMENRL